MVEGEIEKRRIMARLILDLLVYFGGNASPLVLDKILDLIEKAKEINEKLLKLPPEQHKEMLNNYPFKFEILYPKEKKED